MAQAPPNPTNLARETLKMLATRRIPPTPDNYARIFAEISGVPDERGNAKLPPGAEPAGENLRPWSSLIRDLLRQLEITHKGLTISRKKEALEKVLSRFGTNPENLFEKLDGLLHSWSASPSLGSGVETGNAAPATEAASVSAPAVAEPAEPGSQAEISGKLSELLVQTLETTATLEPELAEEIRKIAMQVREADTLQQLEYLAKQLRHFWIKVELHVNDKARIQEGLLRLLRLLVGNVGEMVEDETWVHGQIVTLQQIIANPIDRKTIADAERSLRDSIIKQGLLKQSLTETKKTLKNLMTTFVDRLGEITASTGEYHKKIEVYSEKIAKSSNIADLSHLLDDIMHDTRVIQSNTLRSHEELTSARKQVHDAEEKIKHLEQELAQVSELVREDQLTGALNRRGLEDAFAREATRADRNNTPLCVALLDIDNFKRLNDTRGHHIGDQALVHLSSIVKEALRPSDSVSRYGGEEFVLLLPELSLADAAATVERLQRELTKKYFLHANERILITFSAGVAQRTPNESQEDAIGRADNAMYQAKRAGKNRVAVAPQVDA